MDELTDIALKLRDRFDLGPQQRFRLVGVGFSNFQDAGETIHSRLFSNESASVCRLSWHLLLRHLPHF
jgi:DNA polymerase IV